MYTTSGRTILPIFRKSTFLNDLLSTVNISLEDLMIVYLYHTVASYMQEYRSGCHVPEIYATSVRSVSGLHCIVSMYIFLFL